MELPLALAYVHLHHAGDSLNVKGISVSLLLYLQFWKLHLLYVYISMFCDVSNSFRNRDLYNLITVMVDWINYFIIQFGRPASFSFSS